MGFYKDITGNRYGSLLVLGYSHSDKNTSYWKCLCDCGNTAVINRQNLVGGGSKTCGCSHYNRPHKNRVGERHGRLTVIKEAGRKYGDIAWLCKCDCGAETIVASSSLNSSGTQSCGCLIKEATIAKVTKHGMYGTRIYRIYRNMLGRCYEPGNSIYKYYGGRSISVCDEWRGENGFSAFLSWALKNGYADNLSLDRIDVDGNYAPSNCRWVTQKEQCNNKRTNIIVNYQGNDMTISQFSDAIEAPYNWVRYRVREKGMTADETANEWIKIKEAS